MNTLGVIFCGFRCMDTLARAVAPWVEARKTGLANQRWLICVVSQPFAGFDNGPEDGTADYLSAHLAAGEIDHLITGETPVKETEARGGALRWLVGAGATDLWQADADEFVTADQLARIMAFWAARPYLCWARLCYKNRVFTPDQYLVEPFTPPRIHRVRPPGTLYDARSFWDDNNVAYHGAGERDVYRDVLFPSVVVPKNLVWIDHETWLSNDRSRRKCLYQSSRVGWVCSFDWDDSRGGLIWRDGVAVPETARDE